ncbi:MAG: TonB-dependent siderophore receptor [Cytophagaceae bacterium]|nr:TonB-dependent siderophore receptor [Cytophagaceae bacterium]
MKRLTILLLLLSNSIFAQQSTVTGKVTDDKNNSIPYASVYFPELLKGTSADVNGEYFIDNVPYGEYKIQISAIGFIKWVQDITINKNPQVLNISLKGDNELDAVEVFGNRYKRPDKIEALTRLPLEPYEQIQSISVISEKLIENQGALTISEATKNVPGVYTFATYGNKRESMSSRGFRGIPILKNGVRVNSDFRGTGILTDMQGVDNIQVLKGAASITQGVATDIGSPGGVINIVTKTPKYTFGGNASLRAGSYGQVRPTFDVYGPINDQKTLAFRLDGALERADSYRSGISSERFYINPSLQWKLDQKTRITLEMDYMDDSRTPDVGTVNLGENDTNNIYDLPYNVFLGYQDDRSITENTTFSVRFDRDINDKLMLKGAFYQSNLSTDDKGASLGDVVEEDGDPVYNLRERGYGVSTRSDKNNVVQLDLVGDALRTGKITHTFQVGMDYRTTDYSTFSQSAGGLDLIDVFSSENNHVLPGDIDFGAARTGGAESRSIGFVAQDVVGWTKWLKSFLGLRYSTTTTINGEENTYSDAFNPLVGVIASPWKNINVFTSYTNSSYPRTAARLDENGDQLGNERFDQLEAGVKTTWLDNRLRFNLTYFKINNKNINLPVYDENWVATGFYQKGGNDQRQGIEVELTGRILENLEVITGYSYIDAQYLEHTSFVYGSAPLNTPKHTFNAYVNYTFTGNLDGLSLGGGAYYTGERPINDWSAGPVTHEGIVPNQEPFYVGAYTLVNAQVNYKFDKSWGVRILANNLFDTIGYNAYRTRFINQTDPRTFAAVLNYSF